jgi:nicotinamide mononucleotide (NMN) deamidase PncC
MEALRALIREAVAGGYLNIDVDTSTLVDLSKQTIKEQQDVNTSLSAELTAYIRSMEPAGVSISVGGEIGEVGGHPRKKSCEHTLMVSTKKSSHMGI